MMNIAIVTTHAYDIPSHNRYPFRPSVPCVTKKSRYITAPNVTDHPDF